LEYFYQAIVEHSPNGMVLLNQEGQVVFINPAATSLLGLKAAAVIGKKMDGLVAFHHPKDGGIYELTELPYAKTLVTGANFKDVTMGLKIGQNPERWLSVSSDLLLKENEEIRQVLITITDVTAHVQGVLNSQTREKHLHSVISAMDDILFEIAPSGKILNGWTNLPEKLFFPLEQMTEKSVYGLFPEDLADQFRSTIQKSFRTNTTCEMEYQAPFTSHEGTWYKLKTRPISASHENLLVNISDITEAKRAKEQLKAMDIRWKFVLENADLLLCDWDLTKHSVSISGSLAKQLDLHTTEITIDQIKNRIHPDDLDTFNYVLTKCLNGDDKLYTQDYRIQRSDGSYTWLHAKSVVTGYESDGKPDRILCIGSDMTGWMNILEEVRISEEKFNQAFQYSGIGKALVDIHGRFMNVNQTLCKILGYPSEILENLTFQQITHPDDISTDLTYLAELVKGNIDSYNMEKRYLHKQGHFIWCSLTVSMVQNADKQPAFFVSQIEDISQIKRQLEILEHQTSELDLANNRLENNLRQLEEFDQIVAHNLKGPASNIAMLLQEMENCEDTEEKEQYLHYLSQSSDHLLQILQDLTQVLDVRKATVLEFELCYFKDILQDTIGSLSNKGYDFDKVKISTDFQLPGIQYVKTYLQSIFYNLVSNSLKYIRPQVDCQIHLQAYECGSYIKLIFRDNGKGIDMTKEGLHLFKFKTTFKQNDRPGVGLFLTRYQIEKFGGNIVVESQLGEGTVFTIVFEKNKLHKPQA
jgi:PAS domain S-box-containing protein